MQSLAYATPTERPRPLLVLAAAAAALLALCLLWGLVETRTIDGVPVWHKPAKFAGSFVATFGTLALLESRLSRPWAEGWVLRGTTAVMAAAFLAEMAWMTFQAARAEASHFNVSTPLHGFMYRQVMGTGAVLLVLGIGIFGWAALRDRAADLSPALRRAAGLGHVLAFVLTLAVAGYMSAGTGAMVGTPGPEARVLPGLGWSASVGDLRPAHFLALHAMQVLPLYALWRERSGRTARPGEMTLAALAWAALTLGVFAQALLGLPLVRL
jgi:hypothetical protein